MEIETYPGSQLITFLRERMTMSSYYQPLVVRELVLHGGRRSSIDLAPAILIEDDFAVGRARDVLMRWPRRTLRKHGVVGYDRTRREFVLPVLFGSDAEQSEVLDLCAAALARWRKTEAPRIASLRFRILERAGGRCEACGVPGSLRPIDVDHIVPRSRARRGMVEGPEGAVPVDDERNLQALCATCNRGKRDTSTFDFRLSTDRLVETMSLLIAKAEEIGLERGEFVRRSLAAVSAGEGGRR